MWSLYINKQISQVEHELLRIPIGRKLTGWLNFTLMDHFTVSYLVTWPLNGSEAGGNLVLIQTSMVLLCKSSCSYANYLAFR